MKKFGKVAALAALALSLAFAGCDNGSSSPVLFIPQNTTQKKGSEQTTNLPNPFAVPLTLEAAVAGAVVSFSSKAAEPVTYKINGGESKTIAGGAFVNITLPEVGDKVEFWGDNKTYSYIPDIGITQQSNILCSVDCYIYGNIMSLVKSKDFSDAKALEGKNTFECLFKSNAHIKNKEGAVLLLPATTLAQNCYLEMFHGCAGLTSAPALPATTLSDWCYAGMFQDCAGLSQAPELPAKALAQFCYSSMFQGCSNLTKAAELPAETLIQHCYELMFKNCPKLEEAPALNAKKLEFESYKGMFLGCSGLKKITCLATDLSEYGCLSDWVKDVAAAGAFTKAAGVVWPEGTSGIPSGWTVNEH